MRKALAVYRKELRQIMRDRRTLLILVFIPALFLLLYGYALNFDIKHIALAVDDRDGTPQSRSVVSAFVNAHYQAVYRTPLRFAIITPGTVAYSVLLSLVLGIGAGVLAARRLARTPPLTLFGR